MQVTAFEKDGGKITAVWSEAAARRKAQRAASYVLATGGILGGGIVAEERGYAQDTIFNLAVRITPERSAWFQPEFCAPPGHPIFRAGLAVNADFQPIDAHLQPHHDNLYAAGGILGSCDPVRERSLEGIALATGYAVGRKV